MVSWLLLFVSRAASSLSLWIRIYFSSLVSCFLERILLCCWSWFCHRPFRRRISFFSLARESNCRSGSRCFLSFSFLFKIYLCCWRGWLWLFEYFFVIALVNFLFFLKNGQGSYRYRHRGFSTIFCTQIILFPLFLVLIAIGALLGAPLYLFLGSFMIFPSSPTRQRFWKDWGVNVSLPFFLSLFLFSFFLSLCHR